MLIIFSNFVYVSSTILYRFFSAARNEHLKGKERTEQETRESTKNCNTDRYMHARLETPRFFLFFFTRILEKKRIEKVHRQRNGKTKSTKFLLWLKVLATNQSFYLCLYQPASIYTFATYHHRIAFLLYSFFFLQCLLKVATILLVDCANAGKIYE